MVNDHKKLRNRRNSFRSSWESLKDGIISDDDNTDPDKYELIDPTTGEYLPQEAKETQKPVNDLTRAFHFAVNYRGGNPFMKQMKGLIRAKGVASLTEKQIEAILNIKATHLSHKERHKKLDIEFRRLKKRREKERENE